MLKGFKDFILRGNVVDLAVAVVVGAAFTAIVTAIVGSVINPAIGAVFNAKSLDTALPVVIPTLRSATSAISPRHRPRPPLDRVTSALWDSRGQPPPGRWLT